MEDIIRSVAFFGSSKTPPNDPEFKMAREVAKIVAQSGRKVVNGGGPGIMMAATLGAKDVHGQTTAVYYEPKFATTFEGKDAVNLADTQYEEENYVGRTRRLLELGDLYIIFNGGTGTISEFGMAWGLARLYFGSHKPIILFGQFWHNIISVFKANMKITPQEFEVFRIITTPEEVTPTIEKFETIIKSNRNLKHPKDINDSESYLLL
jgi:hypothetical protein